MKLAYRRMGIDSQIWAVLELLGDDFSFYDLDHNMDSEGEGRLATRYDVNTYVFVGRHGTPDGFLLRVKGWNHEQALYLTITLHGAGGFPVVYDWTVGAPEFDARKPPVTWQDRPEDVRVAHFEPHDIGQTADYIRQVIFFYMTGKKSDPKVERVTMIPVGVNS